MLVYEATDYDIDEFNIIMLKRTKCRGGGICILIKKWLELKVKLVKQIEDSLIWLKLDRSFFSESSDIYLCCAYIPPEGNQYYQHYDCDLFDILENDLELFSRSGIVCLTGDLNARTVLLDDVIRTDDIHQTLIDNMETLFSYPYDPSVTEGKSKDTHVNTHGRRLITLCKESGLRIINGRTKSVKSGDIT